MKKAAAILLAIFFSLFLPIPVLADTCGKLSGPGCVCAPNTDDVPSIGCFAPIIVNIIGFAYAFLGAVTLFFLLWGAIKYVTSAGDPKALQSAQKTMTYAVIGAIIVLSAFIITNIIANALGFGNLLQSFTLYQP